MHEAFIEPLEFAFMQRAFIAAALAGVVCAVVGTFVVLKGLGFMGDAIAHSSLTGMAAAFALGGNVLWGALAWVVPASFGMTFLARRSRLVMDTSIGIIYAAGFSLGIIILSRVDNFTPDLFSFLFGNVLGASWGDVAAIGGVTAGVLTLVFLLYKELLATSYDADLAEASGVPVKLVQYALPLFIGVTTVAALTSVGIVLVLALLVTPAATARILARRVPGIMAGAVVVALASVVGGLYLSFHLDLPSGPTIVLFSTGLFGVAFLVSLSEGVLWRRPRFVTTPARSNEA
ncbi:MAG: metal ABC transporter permease [Chloroflexi bacterium]|nr:metal ABC transporter permease [Chloroflexota bacterium]